MPRLGSPGPDQLGKDSTPPQPSPQQCTPPFSLLQMVPKPRNTDVRSKLVYRVQFIKQLFASALNQCIFIDPNSVCHEQQSIVAKHKSKQTSECMGSALPDFPVEVVKNVRKGIFLMKMENVNVVLLNATIHVT